MALQRLPRLAIDAYHNTIRVTREINTNFNVDLAELFLYLFLLFLFAFLDVRAEFTGDPRNFVEERELSLIEIALIIGETGNQGVHKPIQGWLERIRLFALLVMEYEQPWSPPLTT